MCLSCVIENENEYVISINQKEEIRIGSRILVHDILRLTKLGVYDLQRT